VETSRQRNASNSRNCSEKPNSISVFVVPQTLEVTTAQPEAHTAAGQELASSSSSSSSSSQQKLFRFLSQGNSGVFSPTNVFVEKKTKSSHKLQRMLPRYKLVPACNSNNSRQRSPKP